jgi:hypothetical protein
MPISAGVAMGQSRDTWPRSTSTPASSPRPNPATSEHSSSKPGVSVKHCAVQG